LRVVKGNPLACSDLVGQGVLRCTCKNFWILDYRKLLDPTDRRKQVAPGNGRLPLDLNGTCSCWSRLVIKTDFAGLRKIERLGRRTRVKSPLPVMCQTPALSGKPSREGPKRCSVGGQPDPPWWGKVQVSCSFGFGVCCSDHYVHFYVVRTDSRAGVMGHSWFVGQNQCPSVFVLVPVGWRKIHVRLLPATFGAENDHL